MNHFEASKKLLNRSMFNTLNIRERVNIAFVDSDFVPLMCHENYLSSAKKKGNKLEDFQKIVKAT